MWIDIAETLASGPPGPWSLFGQTSPNGLVAWHPVIQPRPFDAWRHHDRGSKQIETIRQGSNVPQNASLLYDSHPRRLDDRTCHSHSSELLAFGEVFSFAAFSEMQFINVMKAAIAEEVDPDSLYLQRESDITNLLAFKHLLDRHAARLEHNIDFLEQLAKKQRLTRVALEVDSNTRLGVQSILKDFEHLLKRARVLMSECDGGMTIVLNQTNIKEAQKAMAQAEGVVRLTKLAFVFIPLSLTTSFFGMNFKELEGGGTLSVWVWFVVSAPVLAISLALIWDLKEVLVWLQARMHRRTWKHGA